MNPNKFLGGAIVLVIGVFFLLANFGYADYSSLAQFAKYWPIILVVMGLSILFKALPKPLEIVLSVLLSLCIVAGSIMLLVQTTGRGQMAWTSEATIKQIAEPFNESAQNANISVNTGASSLQLSGGSSLLIEGTIESFFATPTIGRKLTNSGQTDSLAISQDGNFWTGWHMGNKNSWDLKISDEVQTELEVNAGASKIDIDLSGTNVSVMDINAGASKITLDLGTRSTSLSSQIKAGASAINLRVPESYGVSIKMDSALISNNFDSQDLYKNDQTYTSKNYEQATNKVQIDLDAGASSINVERY